ncbi:hypothetical protein ABFP60_19690 [Clostridioides difficile]
MSNYITEILRGMGIPSYYLKRPQDIEECIIYSFNEYKGHMADNTEETIKYDCYFNIIIKSNISNTINKMKSILESNGFRKVVINSPMITEGVDFYQITMNFQKYMAKNAI